MAQTKAKTAASRLTAIESIANKRMKMSLTKTMITNGKSPQMRIKIPTRTTTKTMNTGKDNAMEMRSIEIAQECRKANARTQVCGGRLRYPSCDCQRPRPHRKWMAWIIAVITSKPMGRLAPVCVSSLYCQCPQLDPGLSSWPASSSMSSSSSWA